MSKSINFNLVNITPVGFTVPYYPTKYCPVCRGYLTELCCECISNGCTTCTVTKKDNIYYHTHCHNVTKINK